MERDFKYKRGDILESWHIERGKTTVEFYLVLRLIDKEYDPAYSRRRYEMYDIIANEKVKMSASYVENPRLVMPKTKYGPGSIGGWRNVSKENKNA